jgi:hypothetical protein
MLQLLLPVVCVQQLFLDRHWREKTMHIVVGLLFVMDVLVTERRRDSVD